MYHKTTDDNFRFFTKTQRGTATGFFLAGVVLGSPLGMMPILQRGQPILI
jgi:hypothetical protein